MVNELLKVGHHNPDLYTENGLKAVQTEPELFAHMIAWNYKKGKVRSSKIALPVIALRGTPDMEWWENAVAHLCTLDPRNLVNATVFNKDLTKRGLRVGEGAGRLLKNGVNMYIRARERHPSWWTKTAVQHRRSLKALYAYYHIKPSPIAQDVLFNGKRPEGSIFEAIELMKTMTPLQAAGTIVEMGIPYTIAVTVVPDIKDPNVVMALMNQMSGTELITNTKMLKELGVFRNAALKSAYNDAMERAKKDKKTSTLKASKAAEVIDGDEAQTKLTKIQEDQMEKLDKAEGDWLILGDRSGSMYRAIKLSRQIAGFLAKGVKGRVWVVFFNQAPMAYEVTGMSYADIIQKTRSVHASGATSVGVGLDWMLRAGNIVNGIVICSDGGHNTAPDFSLVYKRYCDKFGIEPAVYFMKMEGDNDRLTSECKRNKVDIDTFDLRRDVDLNSIPEILPLLKANRYALIDEIMETPLLTLKDVLKNVAKN